MIEQPKLSPVPKLKLYILLEDYPAVYGDMKILIPKGFVFDGASIPFIGWLPTYTPFHPLVMASAICHDWIFYFQFFHERSKILILVKIYLLK